jgi:hypothetical protein
MRPLGIEFIRESTMAAEFVRLGQRKMPLPRHSFASTRVDEVDEMIVKL